MLRLVFLFCSLFSTSIFADYLSVDYQLGNQDLHGVRIGYSPWEFSWQQLPIIDDLSLSVEFSAAYWTDRDAEFSDSIVTLAVAPVFRTDLFSIAQYPVYFEFGIGVAALDDNQVGSRDIASYYQFEDRLGFGIRFGEELQQAISLKYFHYSNAGFDEPNSGLDFFNLSYRWSF